MIHGIHAGHVGEQHLRSTDTVSYTHLTNVPHDPALPRSATRFYSFWERRPGTGTLGDPRTATARKGEAILSAQANALAELIKNPDAWSAVDQVWSPGRGLRHID